MSTTAVFEFADSGRLNISVIGIGDWGCAILKEILKEGLPYALTLALPTSEVVRHFRHPAARVLPLYKGNHYDNAHKVLENSDLNIFLVSSRVHVDMVAAHEFLKANSCKYLVITDSRIEHFAEFNQNLASPPLSLLYLDTIDETYANNLVAKYLTTIFNIMYNHRIKGIEYFEIASFTGDDQCKLASSQTFEITIDRLHEISTSLHNVTPPATRRSIICIQYINRSGFPPVLVDDDIRLNYAVPALICFVPNTVVESNLVVTAIFFE